MRCRSITKNMLRIPNKHTHTHTCTQKARKRHLDSGRNVCRSLPGEDLSHEPWVILITMLGTSFHLIHFEHTQIKKENKLMLLHLQLRIKAQRKMRPTRTLAKTEQNRIRRAKENKKLALATRPARVSGRGRADQRECECEGEKVECTQMHCLLRRVATHPPECAYTQDPRQNQGFWTYRLDKVTGPGSPAMSP